MLTNKFVFDILVPLKKGALKVQLDELYRLLLDFCESKELSIGQLVIARLYLTDAANQLKKVREHQLFRFLSEGTAVSYIEQPMIGGCKVALSLMFLNEDGIYKEISDGVVKMECSDGKILFQTVRFKADEASEMNEEEQTREAFNRHVALLNQEGMTLLDDCHRTWLYVRDIDRHYAGVVKGRNNLFASQGLTQQTHYIASTGIEGSTDVHEAIVAVDFLSLTGMNQPDVKYLQALEFLNPTFQYGVAFERGTSLTIAGDRLHLISGTASIDKQGKCLFQGDVLKQTKRLFLNIEKLLCDGSASLDDMKYMIVYLRDISDANVVERFLKQNFSHVPFLITSARVCRPEWLIEIETIAVT